MVRTNPGTRVALLLAALLALAMSLLSPGQVAAHSGSIGLAGGAASAATGQKLDTVDVDLVSIRVESPGAVTSASLAADQEAVLRDIQQVMTTVVGVRPEQPLVVRLAGGDDLPTPESAGWIAVAPDTWINANASVALIDLDAWLALPDVEAHNRLRYVIARHWLADAAGGRMPPALLDGLARYLQTPVLAEQARRASQVQQVYLDDALPSWQDMVGKPAAPEPAFDDAVASQHLALAAFLVEQYGANIITELASQLASAPERDPANVIVDVTGQSAERLDDSWEAFLASWFAGGWRVNVFSALDLEPAEDLFARGAYEAAVDRANQTLLLTTALEDRVGGAEAEQLVAQGSVGMQAEALMTDAETALREHDYSRALVLIDRASDQYALLPESHRPDSLLDSWQDLATQGADAIDQLEQARTDASDWFAMRGARRDAIDAGATFASLGDSERLAGADSLIDELNGRLFRLVLALGGATVLLVTWLLVWSWNRAPGRVRWPETTISRREVTT